MHALIRRRSVAWRKLIARRTSAHPVSKRRTQTLSVAHFPDKYGEDPKGYVALLWRAIEAHGVRVVHAPRLTPSWVGQQKAVDVVHLHWLEFIVQSDARPVTGLVRTAARGLRLIAALAELRRRGVGIVWTVHNLGPHEPVRPRLEFALGKAVMRFCDKAIVHSDYARERVSQRYGAREKLAVIPHGNYVGVFADDLRKREAIRGALGIPESAFVFLAFGQVRPYKRLPELVSALRGVDGHDVRLIIAGAPTHEAETARLREAARTDRRVLLDLRRIPDEEISALHRCADAAVLAYRDVFSSGALLLAVSYGLPIVAPSQGSAAELVEVPGIEPFSPGRIAEALDRMRRTGDREARRHAAMRAAQRCSWERVGNVTAALYRQTCVEKLCHRPAL